MLYSSVHQFSRNFLKVFTLVLISLMIVLIYGCIQNRSKDFIKLDAPLRDVLPKITLVVPEEESKDGKPLEITVGSTFSGEGEYTVGAGETHKFTYTFYKKHVVEANKYIFVVVSYNWGGTGTFYYLTAVEKTTFKGAQAFLLGDRVEIKKVYMFKPYRGDYVTVNYKGRESGTSMSEKPDKAIEQHFTIHQGKLMDVKFVDEK
ncbi:MAG: hypothetical protein OXM61_10160 [Candidatus Poribacteria bacterium]|nr:hypothetical protein [Candidatus Poribacteria bacterium]